MKLLLNANKPIVVALLTSAVLCSAATATAQSTSQSFTLERGWNAIYLRVQPVGPDGDPEQVFGSGTPGVVSVWNWSPRQQGIEFIQSPAELDAADPAWLRWIAANPGISNLQFLRANHAYLVEYAGALPTTLTLFGKPQPPAIHWIPNSFHLTGLPASGNTFENFFEGSRAHRAGLVYQLASDRQTWELVDPTVGTIDADQAYWIFSEEGSDYLGPLEVRVPQVDRLAFGAAVVDQPVTIFNRSSATRTVTISSALTTASNRLYLANPDPTAPDDQAFLLLPQSLDVPAGDSLEATVALRRFGMNQGPYAASLVVTDVQGSRAEFPVTAIVNTIPIDLAGLWAGTVRVDAVSGAQAYVRTCQECNPLVDAQGEALDCPERGQPAPVGETHYGICIDANSLPIVADTTTPQPVASPFAFRVLIHVDDAGQARLLKEAIQLGRDDTGPNAGEFVLLTNDAGIPFFEPTALRDGEFVGRRISTAAYDFVGDTLTMTGALGTQLDVDIAVPADLPTNPFLHRYHPDHDGLTPQYQPETGLPANLFEVPTITRRFEFSFDPPDPNTLLSGYTSAGGSFREEVTGLHKNTIVSAGTFDLRRISFVRHLDPSQ